MRRLSVRSYSRGQLASDTLTTNVRLLWHVVMRYFILYCDAEDVGIKDVDPFFTSWVASIEAAVHQVRRRDSGSTLPNLY
jgi:hypothetical protein